MSVNITTLPPLPTVSQQIITQALTNLSNSATKDLVIDSSNNLGYRTNNTSKSYGHIYLYNNNIATVISATNTPVVFNSTSFILNPISLNFEMSANGRLKYVGITTSQFFIEITADIQGGSNPQQQTTTNLLLNGTTINTTAIKQTVGNGLAQNGVMSTIVNLNTNDYIEISLSNNTSTNNLTIVNCNIICFSIN
jgi:hypothetical protein